MSWVRIHDGAMDHPKIVGLSDKAFRLWVWGLSYSQQYLTDGQLPMMALPSRLKRAAGRLVEKQLWEQGTDAYRVHDYLDWNDARTLVLKKRSEARVRIANARQRSSQNVRANFYVDRGVKESFSSEGVQGKPSDPARDPFTDDAITTRAGSFIERYQQLYQRHRKGARYVPSPTKDYQAAVELCATFTDDAHLDKIATIFLLTDHKFAADGSRTLTQFKAMASWCDSRLADAKA